MCTDSSENFIINVQASFMQLVINALKQEWKGVHIFSVVYFVNVCFCGLNIYLLQIQVHFLIYFVVSTKYWTVVARMDTTEF
jgi:hypothetical protein